LIPAYTIFLFFAFGIGTGLNPFWDESSLIIKRPSNALWYLAAAGAVLHLPRWLRLKQKSTLTLAYVFFAVYSIGSLYWLERSELMRGVNMLGLLLFVIPISYGIRYYAIEEQCAKFFVWGSLAAIGLLLYAQHFIAINTYGGIDRFGMLVGLRGKLTNPNTVGSQMAVAALLTSVFLGQSLRKSLRYLLAGIFVLVAVWSGSRTVAIAILLAYLYYYSSGSSRLPRLFYVIYGVAVLLLFAQYLPLEPFSLLFSRMTEIEEIATLGDRTLIFPAFIEVITKNIENLMFGVGVGGSWRALGETAVHESIKVGIEGIQRLSAHNGYLEIMINFGLVGILLSLFLLKETYTTIRENAPASEKYGIYTFVVFVAVISMGTVPFVQDWWYVVAAFILLGTYPREEKDLEEAG
jgi:O-antigen ligase